MEMAKNVISVHDYTDACRFVETAKASMFNTSNHSHILQTSMVIIHRLAGYLVLSETYMMLLNPTLHKCSNS